MSWVLKHSPAQLVDRLVLLVIADHANKDGGGSYPSPKLIAHEARCSLRSAHYALDALEEAGAIRCTGKHGRTRVWKVQMTEEAASATFAPRRSADVAPRQCNPRQGSVQHATSQSAQPRTTRASLSALEPSTLTVPEPPLRAPARASGRAEGGGSEIPAFATPPGASPRTAARLARTRDRLAGTNSPGGAGT